MRLRISEHRSWEFQYLSSTVPRAGIEPTTLRSRVRHCNHWATATDAFGGIVRMLVSLSNGNYEHLNSDDSH